MIIADYNLAGLASASLAAMDLSGGDLTLI